MSGKDNVKSSQKMFGIFKLSGKNCFLAYAE